MKCQYCNSNIPNGSKFCNRCGKQIEEINFEVNCPQCHKVIPSDSVFCPFCGIPLSKRNQEDNNAVIHTEHHGVSFPLFDIILGETTIEEIADSHDLWGSVTERGSDGWEIELVFCNI